MELIDGKKLSQEIFDEIRQEVSEHPTSQPAVAFVRVGEDPASVSYVRTKERRAEEVGIRSELVLLPDTISQAALFDEIDRLNADPSIHGILVQSPLPPHIDEKEVFNRVSPDKDVDGFGTQSLGRLVQEDERAFVACTPAGIVEMVRRTGIHTRGKHVVVVGRSLIVGKPAALLFMRKHAFGDATVTVCHSRTENLAEITQSADILIAAIGRPRFITADMVKNGATVIDVGINRIEDASAKRGYRIVGDVDFENVAPKCAQITPVPGGVGQMTVAMLMANTLKAFRQSQQSST